MKKAPWIIGSITTLVLAAYGCGGGSSGTTSTSTGAGGEGTTTTGTATGTATATGAGGGATTGTTTATTGTSTATTGVGGSGGSGGSGGGLGTVSCNPFTAKECDTAGGESCDYDGFSFSCFMPPNTAKLCGACNVDPGDGGTADFCNVGLTCLDSNQCAAFCCTDADCGANGKCDLTFLGDPKVGVCVDAIADDSGVAKPACTIPSPKPSGGSCFTP